MIGGEAIAGFAIGADSESSVIYPPVSRIMGAGTTTAAPLRVLYEEMLWDSDEEILWDDDTPIYWDE